LATDSDRGQAAAGAEPFFPAPAEGGGTFALTDDDFRLSAYDYELPPELIAQEPVEPRDAARLLVVRRDAPELEHAVFRDLPRWLEPGDVLVVNETRVIPARLIGRRRGTGGRVELLLLPSGDGPSGGGADDSVWRALARPARRLRVGAVVDLPAGIVAEVVGEESEGVRRVRLTAGGRPLAEALAEGGQVPLPPYIRRSLPDPERYQTVYAKEAGSVAAPTAGLHFTPRLLETLKEKGVHIVSLLLHVGRGTFQPVETEDVRRHRMEAEYFVIPPETTRAVNDAREKGRRVVAVGTTVTRTLETSAHRHGRVEAGEGWTDLFITPGFEFKAVGGIITNFHLPKTTLLMLVSAWLGRERTLAVYREAINRGYRFYSFGDAMLLL